MLASHLHNLALTLRERRALMEANHAKPRHLAIALQSLAALLIGRCRHAEAEPLLQRAASFPLRRDALLLAAFMLNSLSDTLCARGALRRRPGRDGGR
ncbi:MAG: hypothetical protein K2X03_16280 [Bryobacteraceae bacterium]|nr:hypothetical protein [Bryobacteraceae bacterium]